MEGRSRPREKYCRTTSETPWATEPLPSAGGAASGAPWQASQLPPWIFPPRRYSVPRLRVTQICWWRVMLRPAETPRSQDASSLADNRTYRNDSVSSVVPQCSAGSLESWGYGEGRFPFHLYLSVTCERKRLCVHGFVTLKVVYYGQVYKQLTFFFGGGKVLDWRNIAVCSTFF